MDVSAEQSYRTPLSDSPLLPLLLYSLLHQRYVPNVSQRFQEEYDYIVVGGGAAGSVLASRLSELASVSVLLLEAGPLPPLLTEVPALSRYFWSSDVSYNYQTVPQKYSAFGLVNQTLPWAAGKMLGGSASLNGMAYVRGNRRNYDEWAAMGARGWSYKEIFRYFLKLEDNRDLPYLRDGFHAIYGPITVGRQDYHPELKKAAVEAAKNMGYRFVDPNAAEQIGFYDLQANIRDNQRCSPVKGYLVPAENRTNLDILVNATASKVLIEDHRAVGVKFHYGGQVYSVRARREVILTAGTVNTPKILMLSGIGPREELENFNISVEADLPVGENFHDQAGIYFPFTLDPRFEDIEEKISDPENIQQYIDTRSGPLASTVSVLMAFLKDRLSDWSYTGLPDYELYIDELSQSAPRGFNLEPEVYNQLFGPYQNRSLFACLVHHLNPRSRGRVTLLSRDPFDSPAIDPNYFEDPRDLDPLVQGLKMCASLVDSAPLRELGAEPFTTRVPGCEEAHSVDAYWRCFAQHLLFTFHHPVGTAKMGDPGDPTTVVDPQLRVKGIEGLRVADASVMPTVTSGNTHIPTLMIAEKAADLIKSTLHPELHR